MPKRTVLTIKIVVSKKAVCIGESLRNSDFSLNTLGQKITDLWDLELYSTYASTEMSTAFTECEHSRGGHHHPELILVEVLDENGQAVAEGEAGEVVISTLQMEAMPLLRFKNRRYLRMVSRCLSMWSYDLAFRSCAWSQGTDDKIQGNNFVSTSII